MKRSDLVTKFEITSVALTGLVKLLMVDVLQMKFWFIIGAGLFWIGYITWSLSKDSGNLLRWGFMAKGFWVTVRGLSVPAALVVVGSAWYGLSKDHLIFNWHLIPVLILYPVWGTLQQFLLISLFGGNLMALSNGRLSKPAVIFLATTLFAIIHYPSLPLIAATFVIALCYMWLFLKFHNIFALGIFHGWRQRCFTSLRLAGMRGWSFWKR